MKKIVSVFLALALIMVTAACVSIKAAQGPGTTASKTAEATAEPTVEPTEEPTPAPTEEPTPAPTEEPTPEPTDTPAPTEVPAAMAVAEAVGKLSQVNSMHMDMGLVLEAEMILSMGEMKTGIPLDMDMNGHIDFSQDPYRMKTDMSLSVMGESMDTLIYGAGDGAGMVLYTSLDGGETWTKEQSDKVPSLAQDPAASLGQVLNLDAANLHRTGEDEVNGQPVTVYAGTVEGKYLQDILSSTGAVDELTGAMGEDLPADILAELGDIGFVVMVEEKSGLPVRYTMDMTEAMRALAGTMLEQSLAEQKLEGMEMRLDIASAVLEMTLSQFDSIEPIVIPEAALSAPEA